MMRSCKRCGSPIDVLILRKRVVHCQSCSSQLSGTANKRHGLSETREYARWASMRERCNNPKAHNYHLYGGRGIRVCERWNSFENFIADMGCRPSKEYSIERLDNDGNYEPSNCKWATKLEQSRNRRGTYTTEEDQRLRSALAGGCNFTQAAAIMGKTRGSVMGRAERLGLKSGQPVRKISDRPGFPLSPANQGGAA